MVAAAECRQLGERQRVEMRCRSRRRHAENHGDREMSVVVTHGVAAQQIETALYEKDWIQALRF